MLQKFRSAINELGYLEGLLYLFNRLVQQRTGAAVLYRYAIMAQPVPEGPLLPAHRGRDIEIRLFSAKDSILTALSLSDEVLEYRFRQGAICLAAFQAGKLIGCLWLCHGRLTCGQPR